MVAIIKTGYSIHRILNYNEDKVKEGVAECIGAGNYPVDPDKMGVHMKLNCLLKQIELDEACKRNSVHISLNFDVTETDFSREKLVEIADVYMEKLGFGKQPYLIYQHYDAAHPHIHLVTTNIQANGPSISLHHLANRMSEPARKAIENDYNLVRAEAQPKQGLYQLAPVNVTKVVYGKSQTKRAIQNILEAVLNQYRYTSLPELNAVLRQYNVTAEKGTEDSRLFRHHGLLYRVLDTQGNPVGVPIKASLFYNKPTLKYLEERFAPNEARRTPYKARVKNAIDLALMGKKIPLLELTNVLEKQGIHVALRRNDAGLIFGVTYVDHQTKCVFNGSDLGKSYSAKALQYRCEQPKDSGQNLHPHSALEPMGPQSLAHAATEAKTAGNPLELPKIFSGAGEILQDLMAPEQTPDYLPYQLKGKGKRRRRKNQSPNR